MAFCSLVGVTILSFSSTKVYITHCVLETLKTAYKYWDETCFSNYGA